MRAANAAELEEYRRAANGFDDGGLNAVEHKRCTERTCCAWRKISVRIRARGRRHSNRRSTRSNRHTARGSITDRLTHNNIAQKQDNADNKHKRMNDSHGGMDGD